MAEQHACDCTQCRTDPLYRLAKINKRLCIVTRDGKTVYTPPDFITVPSRAAFDLMLSQINHGRAVFHAVKSFEARNHPDRAARPPKPRAGLYDALGRN